MRILAFGLNHTTAPVEIREALAFRPEEIPGALARLRDLPELDEVVLLSTCNRTEVYCVCPSPLPALGAALEVLAEERAIPRTQVEPYLYRHMDAGAVRHLYHVTAGLDSMVMGETQILGQVREAYQQGVAAGSVGRVLHHLFHGALHVAKRAHAETGIGQNAVSVSYAAVELAKKLFQTLRGRPVMAIGAGEMSKLTVKHLQAAGAGEIIIANRTRERAERVAAEVDGTPIALDEVARFLPRVDVVISSTGAPGYVLTPGLLQESLRARRGRPIFLFDIAVPRDIDPACGRFDGVYLYDIDDLNQVVLANLQERAREARKVERIADEEVEAFELWLRAQEVAPTIRSLREKVEAIRQQELHRALSKLPHLDERERQVIEAMTISLVKKIMNPPTRVLKGMAEEGDAGALAETMARLFELDPPHPKATGAGTERPGGAARPKLAGDV